MTEDSYEPFVIADVTAGRRFPAALACSVAVNMLLLIGAGTLVREMAETPASDSGYIFLETIERNTAGAKPVAVMKSVEPPSVARTLSVPNREPERVARIATPKIPLPSSGKPSVKTAASDAMVTAKEVTPAPQTVASAVPVTPVLSADGSDSVDGSDARTAASSVVPGDAAPASGTDGVVPPAPAGALPAPVPTVPVPASEPVGITKTAETAYHELPRIPDALRESGYRAFVGVDVEVKEDGTFSVTIRTSSGNPDVDARVLDALKRWKWKPALKNGVPITSMESFRFDFGVD